MQLRFTKMHGLGNDFVVIDNVHQSIQFTPEKIRTIANRHTGVGCDQILLVEKSDLLDSDFIYRIYNSDGSEASQCGNGARAITQFVYNQNLTQKKFIRFKTISTILECQLNDDQSVTVNMGKPNNIQSLSIQSQTGISLSLGNPHVVFLCEDISSIALDDMGKFCNTSSLFPEGVNVSFIQIINRSTLKCRVYERGVGETLACGSAACAAVVAGKYRELLDSKVIVTLPGGQLSIEYQNNTSPVLMSGPAVTVFEGVIEI